MPLYKDFSDANAHILIWKYDENEIFNSTELIESENQNKILSYHPNKISEFLMIRKMLKMQFPKHRIFYKENGEPYLFPNDFEISISHSFPFAALAISKNKIGIDLEKVKEKIKKIRDKFILHENNFINENQEIKYLTAIWCMKEALYKIHHSKHWSLKKHYEILPFEIKENFCGKGRVYDGKNEDFFNARGFFFDDYCFVIVDSEYISS